MTETEAYRILGLPAGTGLQELKKKYRKLMMQMHPDSGTQEKEGCGYSAQEINAAYTALKNLFSKELSSNARPPQGTRSCGHHAGQKTARPVWDAPVNPNAFREREILQYAEAWDGSILGTFCIATGKYMWTTQEDFPLFLRSLYQCSRQILEEAGCEKNNHLLQAELAYLLAQQFISQTALLEEIAKEETADSMGNRIFYIPCMLESPLKSAIALTPGERLYPAGIRRHRLYLKNHAGQEAGYLSFADDRLYYIVVPLFEQKAVKVKIQSAKKQPEHSKRASSGYLKLHLWLKLSDESPKLPENLNLKIQRLLGLV